MVNWRDIDTDTPQGLLDLQTAIAVSKGWFEPAVNELGKPVYRALRNMPYRNPDEGHFAAGQLISNPYVLCPDWSTDANAALELATDESIEVRIIRHIRDEYWLCVIDSPWYDGSHETDNHPAVAICKAWLAHMDKRHE